MIDTDIGSSDCDPTPYGWDHEGQPDACFVVGASIAATSTVVTGSRPLVIVGFDSVSLSTTLDVASHHSAARGPGSPFSSCPAFAIAPQNHVNVGAGGAGGSFMTVGGGGGTCDNGQGVGGSVGSAQAAPTMLRGGCDGQLGATGAMGASTPGGSPGSGGGAVYVVAGTRITISGILNASGAAGLGGDYLAGAGGGGSGGMIVLAAPTIDATGSSIIANGGGGGAGSTVSIRFNDGNDPNPSNPQAGGDGASPINGMGAGGTGEPSSLSARAGQPGAQSQGGGGGGGGFGYIRATVAPIGGVFSPAVAVLP